MGMVPNEEEEVEEVPESVYGLKNYQLRHRPSETWATKNDNVKIMKDTFKNRRKDDKAKVDKLMMLTLSFRRKDDIQGAGIDDIVDEYPWLTKDEDEFVKEMDRIAGLEKRGFLTATFIVINEEAWSPSAIFLSKYT